MGEQIPRCMLFADGITEPRDFRKDLENLLESLLQGGPGGQKTGREFARQEMSI